MFTTQGYGRIFWVLVAAAGLCLSGCTSIGEYVHNGFKVGPNYCPPGGPVAAHWIDAYDSHLRGDTQDLSCWWTVFRDPTLNQLIAHAYRQNISLKEAGFRILEARAQRGIAVGGLFPQTQTLNGSTERVGLPTDQVGPGFPRFYNSYNVGFNLAWQLDFWGQFRRAIESADAQLDASVAGYDEVLITLLSQVASNYVEIRSDQEQIAVLKANAELQRGILAIVDKRYKAGRVNELDVDQAISNLKQVESQIPPLEADVRQANDRLCELLGLPPDDLVKCLGKTPIPTAPPSVAIGIPAELVRRRPDVRQAERLAAAGLDVVGISPDKPEKLAKFRDAEGLTFPLLSDPDRKVLTAWGAFGEKQMYGKTVTGVIRSTFVVDEKGKIAVAQYNVKAAHTTTFIQKKILGA